MRWPGAKRQGPWPEGAGHASQLASVRSEAFHDLAKTRRIAHGKGKKHVLLYARIAVAEPVADGSGRDEDEGKTGRQHGRRDRPQDAAENAGHAARSLDARQDCAGESPFVTGDIDGGEEAVEVVVRISRL